MEKTPMATNDRLVKNWIQYLKNNRIVDLQSDPNTGKLKYRKPVTTEVLFKFLENESNFDETTIRSAIESVLSKGTQGEVPPSNRIGPEKSQTKPSDDDVTDVEYTDIPRKQKPGALPSPSAPKTGQKPEPPKPGPYNPPRRPVSPADTEAATRQYYANKRGENEKNKSEEKPLKPRYKMKIAAPGQKSRLVHKGLNEAFVDNPDQTVDERQVEEIFNTLWSQQTTEPAGGTNTSRSAPVAPTAADTRTKREGEFRKLKKLIRDVMTPAQRKSLWRALGDPNAITEAAVNRSDVRDLFRAASTLRSESGIMGKIFKGLKKPTIDVADLQQAWRDDGFPDDSRDIQGILKNKFGFSDSEIKKVFNKVYGTKDGEEDLMVSKTSPAIQKIADYANQNGLGDALREFLLSEFGEELGLKKKPGLFKRMMSEEIRQVFELIVLEERSDRNRLLSQLEKNRLGRTRK